MDYVVYLQEVDQECVNDGDPLTFSQSMHVNFEGEVKLFVTIKIWDPGGIKIFSNKFKCPPPLQVCVQFLEAVPWSIEEEKMIMSIIPTLGLEESRELVAMVLPSPNDSSEEMLRMIIMASMGCYSYENAIKVKASAAETQKNFPSRDSVRRVLDEVLEKSLKKVKEWLGKYWSPHLRCDDENEKLNFFMAVSHERNLLWLVEQMIELGIADMALKEWSEETLFVAVLWPTCEDVWRNAPPRLPELVLECTAHLADAVANGYIVAPRERQYCN
ncbi:uncharacterized protein LOC143846474 [Tasmannia lanceolata]|uniref:uncharacterized protein LOC143846474 n=1 Tax=Tasmannia lanceolata TaxID=3420 RepID=UPI004063DBE9